MVLPTSKRPCPHFRSRGGCPYGKKCGLSHDLGSTSGTRTPLQSSRQSTSSLPAPTTPRTQPGGSGNATLRNVCDFHWNNHRLDRTFRRQDTSRSAEVASEVVGLQSAPENTHNSAERYVGSESLNDPAKMKPLISILTSANQGNLAWTADKAEEFLHALVRSDKLLSCIGDILRFPDVTPRAKTGSALSFQLDYFPVLEYFTSDLVLESTSHHNINALYAVLYQRWASVSDTIESYLRFAISNRTWDDPTLGPPERLQEKLTGVAVFKTISELVTQVFNRFKTVLETYPQLNGFVERLAEWFDVWATGVLSRPPGFQDSVAYDRGTGRLAVLTLGETIERLRLIIGCEHYASESKRIITSEAALSDAEKAGALLARLEQDYDPPGHLRPDGPRHNNDFANIAQIRICPTSDELMCPVPPYLPVTVPGAPHHLPAGSMERHLDTQFRLLREDLIFPIRESLNVLQEDLDTMRTRPCGRKPKLTELEKLLEKGGGLLKSSGGDPVTFKVYTDVHYARLSTGPQGVAIRLKIRCPPGPGRDPDWKKRVDYWKNPGRKKLTPDSLVALVVVSRGYPTVYLANLVSSAEDIAGSARYLEDSIQVKATFFGPEVKGWAFRKEKIDTDSFAILVDSGVMFGSVQPTLEMLSTIDPTSIPFSQYICTQAPLNNIEVRPPKYSTASVFRFKLQGVAKPGQTIDPLDVNNPASIARARVQLRQFSVLDPGQADSVVGSLTREVSLIRGSPGTGKSFTGKQLLRILLDNKIKPVALLAPTNHALDHILSSILDAKITKKLVRLGSRSTDERVAKYSLGNLENTFAGASVNRRIGMKYTIKRKIEEEMLQAMENIHISEPSEDQIKEYLRTDWGEHLLMMYKPPVWIAKYAARLWGSEGGEGESNVQGKKGKGEERLVHTYYGLWKHGLDIALIQPPQPRLEALKRQGEEQGSQRVQPGVLVPLGQEEQEGRQKWTLKFFSDLGYGDSVPLVPTSNRPFSRLQESPDVWGMSLEERQKLAEYWEEEARRIAYNARLSEHEWLRKLYENACETCEAVSGERRRRLLEGVDLIGCTTTDAAMFASLLTSTRPRVLVVEDAGRVLEAHILASLADSVEHLICIGDPGQLRPSLSTCSLSIESGRGKELFKFDRSLMERLADNGFPMSRINVQHRMRPAISHHIRTILYPELEDDEAVMYYPDVKGMSENVVFFTHNQKEGGGQESTPNVNSFEVSMIVDLVMYFLRQGEYNNEGDIAVLCTYLGQLQKVRAALRSLELTTAANERGGDQVVRQGSHDEDGTLPIRKVTVARHVRLSTVDNFQGQEAKIVIISLVRNSGESDAGDASIGFLKSKNRINVALSRAKHGIYIMGNAPNLRRNHTWSVILDEMEKKGQICFGFPIACAQHPEQVRNVSEPGQLPRIAPLGGCLLPCGFKLSCGHTCRSLCHLDLDNHRNTLCYENCARLACTHQHPCVRLCHQPCGNCEFPISNMILPCGHVEKRVPCHLLQDLKSVKCQKIVTKKLPYCEHSKQVACHKDPPSVTCAEPCDQLMDYCFKKCKARCGECQTWYLDANEVRSGRIKRVIHTEHPCERELYCQHLCGRPCHPKDQGCNNDCEQPCRQQCTHHKCLEPCSVACAPCLEACAWKCVHHECPVACGSICARLPCDEPCAETLRCGHPCPSVCGEPCAIQKCVICMNDDAKTAIVDLIMQRAISGINTTSDDVSEKLITLECGHIFTVETLDGHCSMSEYYEIDPMTGRYVTPKAPPVKYQTPPVCPTCRGPITSPRYGRVTKRASLDILEQNVASNMSKRLEKYGLSAETVTASLEEIETAAHGIPLGDDFASEVTFAQVRCRQKESFGMPNEPLPINMLRELEARHGFSRKEAEAWRKITEEINQIYDAVAGVASTRSAHAKAYEAAMTTLFRLEMEAVTLDPSKTDGITPHEVAFAAVNAKIGQPPYRADRKYHIEAFLLSVELRLMLTQVASARVAGLPLTSDHPDWRRHREIWITFVGFLYDSCIEDCAKAVTLARSCSALRQETRIHVVALRCGFEKLRFHAIENRRRIQTSDLSWDAQLRMRENLGTFVSQHRATAQEAFMRARTRYLHNRPVSSQEEVDEEVLWFRDNCTYRAGKIFAAYKDLQECILRAEVFYQPVSLREKQDIVRALGFARSGHFYNCENGHTFVITECGGAMEASTCPECRAPIGGGNHRLLTSNTRAVDFEQY